MKPILTLSMLILSFCTYAKEGVGLKQAEVFQQNTSLAFIENKGQIIDQHGKHRKDIDFKLEAGGMVMFIGDGQLHYQWYRTNSKVKSKKPKDVFADDKLKRESPPEGDLGVDIYRLDVELIGANKNAEVITEDKQEFYENYYLPQCPDGAVAHSYKKITYKNVYKNIDWVIYINSKFKIQKSKDEEITNHQSQLTNELKYDFVVRPGGNPADIKLQYKGATKLELIDGTLIATTPFGSITENAPYTYYEDSKEEIKSSFILKGNTLSYNLAPLPHVERQREVVIDPVIDWATYFGPTGTNGFTVVTDLSGNVYLAGNIISTGNISTSGAFQTTFNGNDGYIVKFSSTGTRIWATYYGGSMTDFILSSTLDGNGDLYFTGVTNSTNLTASTGAHQTIYGGGAWDFFLVKFTTAGFRLWGTYYGGSGQEYVLGHEGRKLITCDKNNNVYLAGSTFSTSGITTSGAHQPAFGGANIDGVIVKFNASGVRQWGTYYGGNNYDYCTGICSDDSNNVYIIGSTASDTGIATVGCHQYNRNSPANGPDAFVTKFDSSGKRLWGTYYGGTGMDQGDAVTVDNNNHWLYIAGTTQSSNNISTPGSANPAPDSAFLVKFTQGGSRVWGSYFNGSRTYTRICNMLLDENGLIYLASNSNYTTYNIATYCAPQAFKNTRSENGFWNIFDTTGAKVWGTYIGGMASDEAHCIAYDAVTKSIYIALTSRSNGLATNGAFQTTNYGNPNNWSALLVKYLLGIDANIIQPFTDTLACAGDTLRVRYGVTRPFNTNNTFSIQLSNASGSFSSPVTIGSVSATIGGTITCVIPSNTTTSGNYKIRIISTNPVITPCDSQKIAIGAAPPQALIASAITSICAGDTLFLNSTSTSTGITSYSWTGPNSYTSSVQNPKISNAGTVASGVYTLKAGIYGCYSYDTANALVSPMPAKPVANNNSPLCSSDTLRLTATDSTSGVAWSWTGPNSFTSSGQNPFISNSTVAATGSYIVTANLNGCMRKDTTNAVVNLTPVKPVAASNSPVCSGNTLIITSSTSTTGVSWSWTGPNSFTSTTQNPSFANAQTTLTGDYIVTATLGSCSAKDTVTATVYQTPATPNANSNSPLCVGSTLQLTSSTVAGATYSWSGPGGYSSATQNPVCNNVQLLWSGDYIVTANSNGCASEPDTATVVINPGPLVSIYPNPNDSICAGGSITFIAVPTNGGTSPVYQWYKNTSPVGTNSPSYNTSAIATGDVIHCTLTNGSTCSVPATATSNNIPVTVLPLLAPAISISANPATPLSPWQMVTFTANATNGGAGPVYQWKRNGQDIVGATSSVWGTYQLSDHDTICCVLTSSYFCAQPQTANSNCIIVQVLTGIDDVNKNGISIYPNPVRDELIIEGAALNTSVQIFDVLSREVYRGVINSDKQSINTSALVSGTYVLQLTSSTGERVMYKVVKE